MASDLSQLIEDTLTSTLNNSLAKEASLKVTNKAIEKDFEDIELLRIESTYEFENITSTWSYYIPAYTSSMIFNFMLGDDSEPVLELDDDITDAINEFVSQLSGGLTTAINGSGFEDLGNSKFTVNEKEVIPKGSITDTENMYKFTIILDGKDIEVFILFDKVIIPFINAISNSAETIYEEEIVEIPEEIIEESADESNLETDNTQEVSTSEETPQDNKEEVAQTESSEKQKEEDTNKDNSDDKKSDNEETEDSQEELTDEEKKEKKLKKVIMIVAGVLGFTIISGIVMYFLGMFDPEPIIVPKDTNASKIIKTKDNVEIVKYINKSGINFKVSMINKRRLNAKLEALTKYELLDNNAIEAAKIAEKKRLELLKKEEALQKFADQNKEEDIFSTQKVSTTKIVDNKLKFVIVHSLQYKLYKELIATTNSKNSRISICKSEDGRTAVYLGPFENTDTQNKMLSLLKKQNKADVSITNITKNQFNIRCNFE